MKIWVDAQLPPALANWLSAMFELEAVALRDLSLRDAQDIDLVCRLGTRLRFYG